MEFDFLGLSLFLSSFIGAFCGNFLSKSLHNLAYKATKDFSFTDLLNNTSKNLT